MLKLEFKWRNLTDRHWTKFDALMFSTLFTPSFITAAVFLSICYRVSLRFQEGVAALSMKSHAVVLWPPVADWPELSEICFCPRSCAFGDFCFFVELAAGGGASNRGRVHVLSHDRGGGNGLRRRCSDGGNRVCLHAVFYVHGVGKLHPLSRLTLCVAV